MKKTFFTLIIACFTFAAKAQITEIKPKTILFSDGATNNQYKIFKKAIWEGNRTRDYLVVQQQHGHSSDGRVFAIFYPETKLKQGFVAQDLNIKITNFNFTQNKKLAVFYKINNNLDKIDLYEWRNGSFVLSQVSLNSNKHEY